MRCVYLYVLLLLVIGFKHGNSQVICGPGEKACGYQCYDKYSSKKCHSNGVLCDFMEDVCGFQCYTKSLAKKCFPGGVLCDFNEKPCGWRCYKPLEETCHDTGIPNYPPGQYPGNFGQYPGNYGPYPGNYGPGMSNFRPGPNNFMPGPGSFGPPQQGNYGRGNNGRQG